MDVAGRRVGGLLDAAMFLGDDSHDMVEHADLVVAECVGGAYEIGELGLLGAVAREFVEIDAEFHAASSLFVAAPTSGPGSDGCLAVCPLSRRPRAEVFDF